MTPGIQTLIRTNEEAWEEHLRALLDRHDPDAALERVTADLAVAHLPAGTGGRGLGEVRAFYRDVVVPHLPDRRLLWDQAGLLRQLGPG